MNHTSRSCTRSIRWWRRRSRRGRRRSRAGPGADRLGPIGAGPIGPGPMARPDGIADADRPMPDLADSTATLQLAGRRLDAGRRRADARSPRRR